MTLVDATNDILRYFLTKDLACVEDVYQTNFKESELTKENQDLIKTTYFVAFGKLCDLGYCTQLPEEFYTGFTSEKIARNYWVLVKPLDFQDQTIEIDGVLAVSIAEILNKLSRHFGGQEGADSTKISAKNLETLVLGGYELLKHLENE